jgi:UDP-N-acetylglucosamine acyltransferase
LAKVHALSHVDSTAQLADDAVVGPFCFIEAGVVIGARTQLDSHVTIKRGTTLGEDNYVAQGAILGGDPQDRRYKGEPTYLRIGNRNVFREYVTVHRATGEGNSTVIGDDVFLMAFVHLGHNVVVGNSVTMANNVGISGHCTVEDFANLGGMTGVHQWVRIGKVAMVGGMSRIVRDIPPFMITEGLDQQVHDINAVGLRRYGLTSDGRMALHKACKLLYKSKLGLTNAIETVRREVQITPEIEYLLAFEERRFRGKNGRGDQP